jgi:hypothetical protein
VGGSMGPRQPPHISVQVTHGAYEDFFPVMGKSVARRRPPRYKWTEIVTASPQVNFWAYTRSWREKDGRLSALLSYLERLAQLSNIQLWFSGDMDTGLPPTVQNVRVAWLLTPYEQAPQEGPIWYSLSRRGATNRSASPCLWLVRMPPQPPQSRSAPTTRRGLPVMTAGFVGAGRSPVETFFERPSPWFAE